MILPNTVLLLKSQTTKESDDKYTKLLKENSFKVEQGKTLVFEYKNLDTLSEKLKNFDKYEGLIFSSPRCVEAVHLASKNKPTLLKNWQSKRNYAVGEATYTDAFNKLELSCDGKAAGNAENLAHFMLENKNLFTKELFLFPHGNLKTDTLNKELSKEGINIEGVLVYDTVPNPELKHELSAVTNDFQNIPEFVVFFSPSGFRFSINFLKTISEFSNSKLVAIGPVTELAIKEENLKVFGVAKSPTAEEILNVLLQK